VEGRGGDGERRDRGRGLESRADQRRVRKAKQPLI